MNVLKPVKIAGVQESLFRIVGYSIGEERTTLFWDREFSQNTRQNMHFLLVHSPSETFDHKRFPIPKIALIRGKTALMFSEFSILVPIWLSGAESTQKITANSTYWMAKLKGAGGVARSKGKEHLF